MNPGERLMVLVFDAAAGKTELVISKLYPQGDNPIWPVTYVDDVDAKTFCALSLNTVSFTISFVCLSVFVLTSIYAILLVFTLLPALVWTSQDKDRKADKRDGKRDCI